MSKTSNNIKNPAKSRERKSEDKSENSRDFYRNGILDAESYFKFLDEYLAMFPNSKPRTKIVIKNAKF